MHDMLCKCKCKIPPSNALEITLDSWAVQFSHPPCWRQPNSLFLCEFCIILMERPRLNLRSQYWAIWPNLEASSRLGTEIMENSSWEVRPSLPSTRRGRFPGSQRQFFLLLIKMFFWGWTCDKTKRSWTQPSGPLCLWQCLTVSPQKFCS